MKRLLHATVACTALGFCLPGCTGMFTQRAVTAFSTSLQTRDLDRLKASTSDKFEQKALRLSESVSDLKLINLPEGKAKVISIEDKGPHERVVKVQHGENKKPIDYVLKRERNGRWVVDDVLITQKKDGEDKAVQRSISDQMNLLLSVREMLTDWQSGDRDRLYSTVTPDLKKELDGLPPAWMEKIVSRVAGDGPVRSFRPQATMKENRAIVKLNRSASGSGRDGEVLMEFKLVDDRWLLEDASWPGAANTDVSSLRKLAMALTFSRQFLESYGAADKEKLKELSTDSFGECLASCDLSQVSIPVVDLLTKPFEIRQNQNKLDVLLPCEDSTYTLNVVWQNAEGVTPQSDTDTIVQARVEEVTIYDTGLDQVKRLSSMFQVHSVVEYYSELLASNKVEEIQYLSSVSFNDRVWQRFSPEVLKLIHFDEIESQTPKVLSTVFQGPVTEVTVMQGTRALVYVLQTDGSSLKVDDVIIPVIDRPTSLKKQMEVIAPIYQLVHGLRSGDRATLMAASGSSLDRIVWEQTRETPEIGIDIVRRLIAPVSAIKMGELQSRVTLSDGRQVAEVELEEERGRFVVADVKFIDGNGQQPVALLQSMRKQIARDMQRKAAMDILPASAEMPAEKRQLVQPL